MRAVTVVVNRVIVVVVNIVAMMRKLVTTVPKMVGHVHMPIIDTRINKCHNNPFALITLVPNLVGTHLNHIYSIRLA